MERKKLRDQVLFITGASSGIGLATARMAVEQGAKVFLVARSDEELHRISEDMRAKGYEAAFATADVANYTQLQAAADQCVRAFGRIDTFVNNAGISIYSRLMETTNEEAHRLFDTNFWGLVNGCKIAVGVMGEQGGVIINVGSVLSKVALPIQGIYSASKHAVKGYTDALRRELMADELPISVSLILPSAIDTPYPEHARSHIGNPVHTPPVYSPDAVAEAILHCAEKPIRELGVGASAFVFPFLDRLFPRLQDFIMAKTFTGNAQKRKEAPVPREHADAGNLFDAPSREGTARGHYPGHVMKTSLMTTLAEHKTLVEGMVALIGGALYLRKTKSP